MDAQAIDAADGGNPHVFDGGPLPVVCESSPCALSLVTTLGASETDRAEGYCVLLSDGTIACWGAGGSGQLGRGEDGGTDDSATAARVVGLTDIVSLEHTCAIDRSGATYCWGTGPYLRSDASATSTELTPIKLPIGSATKVTATYATSCALVDDGILCWGQNTYGQIEPYERVTSGIASAPRRIPLPPGGSIRDLAVGSASFALRNDGTTVSWGANPPLGRVSPLFPDSYPQPMDLVGIANIDVEHDNACAVSGGIGYCWGAIVVDRNNPAAPTDRGLPEAIEAPEPLVQIATTRTIVESEHGSSIVQPRRWCAVGASGSVYCAGNNASGQAGDGTKRHAYETVKVVGLPGPAAQVRTTPGATCALLASGKVYCWGSDFYGQLGNRTMKLSSLIPQEVLLP